MLIQIKNMAKIQLGKVVENVSTIFETVMAKNMLSL